jgi:superfamily I DNA and RNA helicase
MKYEDWIKYENNRKNKGTGSLVLLKVKSSDTRKKAPNREIVFSLKRRSLADIFRKFLGI